jgi:dynein heavy chain
MRSTLKDKLRECRASLKKNLTKRDKWIKEWPGQLCITSSQMQWTTDCTKALTQVKIRGDKKPLKSLKKTQVCLLPNEPKFTRVNLMFFCFFFFE